MPAGVFSALSVRNSDELKLKFGVLVVEFELRCANLFSRVVINFAWARSSMQTDCGPP